MPFRKVSATTVNICSLGGSNGLAGKSSLCCMLNVEFWTTVKLTPEIQWKSGKSVVDERIFLLAGQRLRETNTHESSMLLSVSFYTSGFETSLILFHFCIQVSCRLGLAGFQHANIKAIDCRKCRSQHYTCHITESGSVISKTRFYCPVTGILF